MKNKRTVKFDIELPGGRLRHDPFAGRRLMVKWVRREKDGDFLVNATIDTPGIEVYGKTSEGAIEGLLLKEDIESLRNRMMHSTVYSRRRLIDIYDSEQSGFTNHKISILEPLKVVDVRPGIIPLPPKPVWVMVERQDGSRGIIPVHPGWTNVQHSKRHSGLPWKYDILEQNLRELYPQWDMYAWETIDRHNIYGGMSSEQVEMSWGPPLKSLQAGSGKREWIYGNSRLLFHENILQDMTGQ